MELLFSSGSIVYNGDCFSGIYGIQCHVNNKWYVGQSIHVPNRVKEYLRGANESQKLIKSAFSKYKNESFSCYKLEECDQKELNDKEIYWGQKLNSMAPNGYNLRLGKANSVVSEETRKKLRIARKKQDERLGHPSLGRKHKESTLILMRKPKSLDQIKKMKESIKKQYSEGRIPWNKGKKMNIESTISGGTI